MIKLTQKDYKSFAAIAEKTASLKPFPKTSQHSKSDRIKKVLGDDWLAFSYFCVTYFPHIFKHNFCQAHQDIFEYVDSRNGILGITGFRGLGKTVEIGVVYPIWKIIKGERYVIHVASDEEIASERTAFTLHELTNNKRLIADFPDLTPLGSDEKDFYLKNRCRVRARGIKQAIRGTINPRTSSRPGIIVCDDIDKEDNMGNPNIGLKRKSKIIHECGGALDEDRGGKVIWLGNLVHPNYAICQFEQELINEIKEDREDFNSDSVQHLFTEEKFLLRFPLEDKEGNSVWPEKYPNEKIPKLKKRFGLVGYLREFLGKAVIEGYMFKHHWFKKWKKLPRRFKRVWLYADPASGEKGCFKAIIAIGYDGFHFYMIKCWIRQTKNSSFFRYYYDAYAELSRRYRARFRASMETVFGQKRVLADFDKWAEENNLIPIGHRIKHINNKENKNLRIERTDTSIESGKILFPDGQDTPILITQYCTYPKGFLDGPDATAGCLERFPEYDVKRNRVRVRSFRT